jgi:hypothetical protein
MAEGAVALELFSASISLILRENTGNFAALGPSRGPIGPEHRALAANSLKPEQGISDPEQGGARASPT